MRSVQPPLLVTRRYGGAGAAQVLLVGLVHGAYVIPAPGLGLLKVVPDELAGPLALSRTGPASSQGPGSSAGNSDTA